MKGVIAVPTEAPEKSSAKSAGTPKVLSAFIGIATLIFTALLAVGRKIVNIAVVFGTTFYSRALVPFTLFLIALISRIADLIAAFRYTLRCFWHSMIVAFGRFSANRFVLAAAVLSATLVIIASTFFSVGIHIFVDNEPIGYMYSKDEYNEALSFVERRATEILEHPYSITQNVRFELGIVPREEIISKDEIRTYFFSKIEEVQMLYALTVDGEIVGASKNRATLQEMLDKLLYTNDSHVTARFAEDVQIVQRYVDSSYLISYDEIREKLSSEVKTTGVYTVRSGDTVSSIARANGMSRSELLKLNPSLKSGTLYEGDSVTVETTRPFLTIEAVRRVEYNETIPYETKKVESSELYKGETKVTSPGKVGVRKVLADVTYVNNKEKSRSIVSNTVTSQPVAKVIAVGTKERPKTVATGKLSRPVRGGIISSNYGMRRGGMHRGVDFASKLGTPVYAADGGTVTWAGWKKGGWGYLVVINHGGGLESMYAHNSKILVHVGQKVAKGQQISKMGSTGNSTGPHCHFEIHVNGRYTSPWKYIK